jgi:hypothetical protein
MEGMEQELSPAISTIPVGAIAVSAVSVSITISAVNAIAVHGISRIYRSYIISGARIDHHRGNPNRHVRPGNHHNRRRGNRSERHHHQNRR